MYVNNEPAAEGNEKINKHPAKTVRKRRLASRYGVDVWARQYLASAWRAAE